MKSYLTILHPQDNENRINNHVLLRITYYNAILITNKIHITPFKLPAGVNPRAEKHGWNTISVCYYSSYKLDPLFFNRG